MSEDDSRPFADKAALEAWLKGKDVREDEVPVGAIAETLLDKHFTHPFMLIDISSRNLIDSGLTIPVANYVSNKLKDKSGQLAPADMADLVSLARDHRLRKATIVLNEATVTAKSTLMDTFHLPEVAATWPNKPANSIPSIDPHTWLQGDEDTSENRAAYMVYLRNMLQLPAGYDVGDMQPNRGLLNTEVFPGLEESRKITGTTDVVIGRVADIREGTIRNNIEGLLELKKPANLRKRDHSPQAVRELFAASYLNYNRPVVGVLTDLGTAWTFFWFARVPNSEEREVALYRHSVAAGEAKYILDSLLSALPGVTLPTALANTLPTTLADRLSFQDVVVSIQNRKRSRSLFDDGGNNAPGNGTESSPPGRDNQHPPSARAPGANGRPARQNNRDSGSTQQSNQRGATNAEGSAGAETNVAAALSLFAPPSARDVANELDLLDMMDEREQYETIRSFASKHIVPYMRG